LKEKSPGELLQDTLDETAILFFDIRGFSTAAWTLVSSDDSRTLRS
tara:strand:- start:317 stop:454 length:138 start_codon:yes stop_codon:yes gene_type:complete